MLRVYILRWNPVVQFITFVSVLLICVEFPCCSIFTGSQKGLIKYSGKELSPWSYWYLIQVFNFPSRRTNKGERVCMCAWKKCIRRFRIPSSHRIVVGGARQSPTTLQTEETLARYNKRHPSLSRSAWAGSLRFPWPHASRTCFSNGLKRLIPPSRLIFKSSGVDPTQVTRSYSTAFKLCLNWQGILKGIVDS